MTRTPAELEESFRQYGSQGFDLVFGHGYECQDTARRVAPGFPRTIFIVTSTDIFASSDVVRLSLNPALSSKVPPLVRARADSVWRALARGESHIPVGASSAARAP